MVMDNITQTLIKLNGILSSRKITQSLFGPADFDNFVHDDKVLLSWRTDLEEIIGFGYLPQTCRIKRYPPLTNEQLESVHSEILKNAVYLLLPKDIIEDDGYSDYKKRLGVLEPSALLDLIFNETHTDPYLFYVQLLNIQEDYFYQAFTCYLNSTIKRVDEPCEPQLDQVIEPFVNKGNQLAYQKLFLFYLDKIFATPITFSYQPYVPKVNFTH